MYFIYKLHVCHYVNVCYSYLSLLLFNLSIFDSWHNCFEIRLDVFHRTCLRRVLWRFWPNHLSNEELYEATGSTPVSALIRVRGWRWIGHILRTSPNSISRTALTWAPEGKRRRGRPRQTRRRTVEKERNQLGWHSWAAVASAADRDGWRNLLAGHKSPHGPDEDK